MSAPERVYADYHATAPLLPEAFDAMRPWLVGLAANPSSVHGPGREARRAVEEARASVAAALGARSEEIVFTSGGTEADNLAIRGGAVAARERDPARIGVAYAAAEHPAVREAARGLAPLGFAPREIAVDANGLPRQESLEEALASRPALVSSMLVNNETGVVNDRLASLAARARAAGALVHTDAVQALGKTAVDAAALGVDLLSLTGHKFGGPKGAGALFVRRGVRVAPQILGGGQERGRRPGTENVAAIAGLGVAIRIATARLAETSARVGALRDRLEREVLGLVPEARVHAAGAPRVPTCSSIVFPGADGESLLMALDLEGVSVSSGSACHSGTTTPSAVLLAMGVSPRDASSTLRFTFGAASAERDVDRILSVLPGLVARVRRAVGASA